MDIRSRNCTAVRRALRQVHWMREALRVPPVGSDHREVSRLRFGVLGRPQLAPRPSEHTSQHRRGARWVYATDIELKCAVGRLRLRRSLGPNALRARLPCHLHHYTCRFRTCNRGAKTTQSGRARPPRARLTLAPTCERYLPLPRTAERHQPLEYDRARVLGSKPSARRSRSTASWPTCGARPPCSGG